MQPFNLFNVGSLEDENLAHGHLTYPLAGRIEEEIITLDMPEFHAHDKALREFLQYHKRPGRHKPPHHLYVRMQETYLALCMALQARVEGRVGGFNRRAISQAQVIN